MSPSRLDDGHESPSLPASVSSDSDGFDSSRTRTAIHKAGSSDGPAKRYAFVDRWTHHRWVSWIKPRLTWPHLRPVVRSAVAAWIGLLLQLIHPTERALGQAAFFVLVVAFMIPPYQPVVQNTEVFLNLYFFNGLAWAWLSLGVFIAGKVRSPVDAAKLAAAEAQWAYLRDSSPSQYNLRLIYEATYLEVNSAVVCSVFLAVGTGALLWYKMRTQPSPATFPLVLSCILLDIGLTTAALYPYPLYTAGKLFFIPMAVQGGIATVCSIVIFPESVAHSFQSKLGGVLVPLSEALGSVETLFADNSDAADDHTAEEDGKRLEAFASRSREVRLEMLKSLDGVVPLRAQQRYLKVDVSYGRLSGRDLRGILDLLVIVQARSGGLAFFFDVIVTNARSQHLDSTAYSVRHATDSHPATRRSSPRNSISLDAEDQHSDLHPQNNEDNHRNARKLHVPGVFHRFGSFQHPLDHAHRGSHLSLLDHLRKTQQPVGVYESQRYMDIERIFNDDTSHVVEQLQLLASTSLPLVRVCREALETSNRWLINANRRRSVTPPDQAVDLEASLNALQQAIKSYQRDRLDVIKPYRHIFDPTNPASDNYKTKPRHRGLYQSFVAQYHFMEFAEALECLLQRLAALERERQSRRLWTPRASDLLTHLRRFNNKDHSPPDDADAEDAGFSHDEMEGDLGEADQRNPEYAPFDRWWLNGLARLASFPNLLRTRSFMYAVKAGVLTTLTTLPQFIASSAAFYYYNRGIWVAIMAQLTLAVYSGDTTSAWIGRCVASLAGALCGMIVWYIGSGSGQGNAYGLAAICAVTFPAAAFFRIHFPGPVLTAVMTPVTFGLVIGYSYLNGTIGQLTNATWGFDVAWRRVVCVLIGITAAWIFSYVPPAFSSKRAIRYSYARVIAVSGTLLCEIITLANDPHDTMEDSDDLRYDLLTWRSKLKKLGIRHTNATYEYSLRGRWPEERYRALLEALQDLLSLLSQLNHVLVGLDKPWRRAVLERTRLSDPVFLGDLLAVITMCSTALRTGTALPQITPSPLVARFRMGKIRGWDLPHDHSEHHHDLPSVVTVDVLESIEYMRYAVAISTTFSMVARLDRMIVICKTLLGENYHIGGLHLETEHA